MRPIPEMTGADIAFGNIKHMPKMDEIPEDFRRHHSNAYTDAASHWFFAGARKIPNGVEVNGEQFTAKDGVDASKALAAIRAILGSFEPKHEHKEAACGYLLSEWFDHQPKKAA